MAGKRRTHDRRFSYLLEKDGDLEELKKLADERGLPSVSALMPVLAAAAANARRAGKPPTRIGPKQRAQIVANKTQILRYSKILLFSLQEVLDYNQTLHHNQPPPDMWLEDESYLVEVRNLVGELNRLNTLLEAIKPNRRQTAQSAVHMAKHFDTFLHHFSSSAGKASGALFIGSIAALLSYSGVGSDVINHIWGHLKLPK